MLSEKMNNAASVIQAAWKGHRVQVTLVRPDVVRLVSNDQHTVHKVSIGSVLYACQMEGFIFCDHPLSLKSEHVTYK